MRPRGNGRIDVKNRNDLAGRRGDGNLIEQNDIFVQSRGGRAGEGCYFDSYFDKVSFPFGAPIFYTKKRLIN